MPTLNARLDRALAEDLATEEWTLKGSTLLPSTVASQFKAGYRVAVHATHLSYLQDDFQHVRLLSVTHTLITPTLYLIEFEAEVRAPTGLCAESMGYPATATGFYPPNNGLESIAPGNIAYHGAGGSPPTVPTTGYDGAVGFPEFGAGGSPDYSGDCVLGSIRFIIVGAGTMTFHTSHYSGGGSRTLTASLIHDDGLIQIVDETQSGIDIGDDIVMEVSTHGGEFCHHYIDVTDNAGPCGGKWGFDGVDWVSSE